MNAPPALTFQFLVAGALLASATTASAVSTPDGEKLAAAIEAGDFAGYLTNVTDWLNSKLPPDEAVSLAGLDKLLKDSELAKAVDQRQLIFKTGADRLAAFAKADPENRKFLAWLMTNTEAMNLYLEAVVPIHPGSREQDSYTLSTVPLQIWKRIDQADPDARNGLYLRLAIATSIGPPGTGAPGAGQTNKPVDPVDRYRHFKTAHQNKELFPSFDGLTVWELSKVTQSGASNEDLAWGRQMINTWRPDLRVNELVVNSTSEVWRRNSPIPFDNCYKNVLAGGGKCGPRSSWSVFICQAFGVPAIGVGQPAHACVAYKAANPMTEPQPGSAWKVGYGRGWHVSKLEGMSGPEFLVGMEARANAAAFSQIEHLRWLAAALNSKNQAAAVLNVAKQIEQVSKAAKTDITASLKPEEAEKEITPKGKLVAASVADVAAIAVRAGETRISPERFSGSQAARVLDCFMGGKQVNFDKNLEESWVEYPLEVETAGTYMLEMRVAAANVDQVLNITTGDKPVAVRVPNTSGLWGMTPAAEIKLDKGRQTLRVSAPFQRGVAIQSLQLKPKS